MRKIITSAITIILSYFTINNGIAQDSTFKLDPYKVLSGWTYEDVMDKYGEGVNIIDTMSGQAYISGFRYSDEWLGRPCDLEFYFTDVNVSRILLRFIHPNKLKMTQEEEKKMNAIKEGLMTGKQFNDSLWNIRYREYPGRFDTIQLDWRRELAYSKFMLEKDSLRSDSIIRDFTKILGSPLREGPTPHTEKDSRYFATWIKNGYSSSVKDYRKNTEVIFSISPAPTIVISEFLLEKETRLIEKALIKVRNETVEVSLLGIPMSRGSGVFDHFYILAEPGSGGRYLDEMPEELQGGSNPGFTILDLTGDGISDIWLHYETRDAPGFTHNFIYTMELVEPLMIFNPLESLEYDFEGELTDDYQAIAIIDGSPRTYIQINRDNPLFKDVYDENGKLLRPATLNAGMVESLESHPYGKGKAHQFRALIPVWGISTSNTVGYIQAIWDYSNGGWRLTSLEVWDD
jgi:hypothetical protein